MSPNAEVRGRPVSRVPHYQPQTEPVNPYMVGNAQHKAEPPPSSPTPVVRSDVDVQRRTSTKPPEYHHEAWHSDEQRKTAIQSHIDSSRSNHKHGHRRNLPSMSNKEEDSPPMTAKDSAYSSLSGASIMSPVSAPPRSAASNVQFGLFPSSSQHSPKPSTSGRLGAMSPAGSNLRSVKSAEPPDRPPTSASNYSGTSKKLPKRGSLQSLRRFFTKKKNDIHSIAE